MQITVKLFATLRQGRFDVRTTEFSSGTKVGDVVKMLGLSEKEVTLIFVSGVHGTFATELHDGDVLALFPPVGGG
jgi:sulfur carrier protein